MTEEEARSWIYARFGSTGVATMAALAAIVLQAQTAQNLIAPSTAGQIWTRHIVDSAQLIPLAAEHAGTWIDIGTGAGFPGLVVAALASRPIILVEPRRRRADFLEQAAAQLGLGDRIIVEKTTIEKITAAARVISARAVASLPELLSMSSGCSSIETLWLLPKGRGATEELEIARREWHGVFHVERSVTDPMSGIIVANGVSRR